MSIILPIFWSDFQLTGHDPVELMGFFAAVVSTNCRNSALKNVILQEDIIVENFEALRIDKLYEGGECAEIVGSIGFYRIHEGDAKSPSKRNGLVYENKCRLNMAEALARISFKPQISDL